MDFQEEPLNIADIPEAGAEELSLSLHHQTSVNVGSNLNNIAPTIASTDMDYWHDVWIPSEETQSILNSLAHSLPGTFQVSAQQLTLPGCSLQSDMADPVTDLMLRYMSGSAARNRNVLSADSVTQDDNGIRQLIQAGCYRAAINLTGRLLENYGQGYGQINQMSKHTVNSVQLWFTRFMLLVQLREFAIADQEASPWQHLDTPDLYFQYYPDLYGNRIGSLIPFNFRILLAELPRYTGNYQSTLDKLYNISSVCDQILSKLSSSISDDGNSDPVIVFQDEAHKLWSSRKLRVLSSIVNCCMGMKDFHLALESLELLLAKLPSHSVPVISAMGRINLQLGNLSGAKKLFDSLTNSKLSTECSSRSKDTQILLNNALMLISENNFSEAERQLSQAMSQEPNNAVILTNIAVCQLYQGHLSTAIKTIETAVYSTPEFLQETILLNLCTLYELQTAKCNKKKVDLLAEVGKHCGDGFNIGCLKLQ